MKKIIALILLLSCAFSMASCSLVPVHDSEDLVLILEECGYKVTDVDEEVQEGIVGYIYGYNSETKDEIYYIYCENIMSAKRIYDYASSKQKAKIAELKMEIEKIEYALYKSEGISAAEKGDYYEKYVEKTEELEEVENYSYGHGFNVVWYGTKQAVADIKKG